MSIKQVGGAGSFVRRETILKRARGIVRYYIG